MSSMPLIKQQAALLNLVKGRPVDWKGDSYLATVADSRGLAMIREIALWWRAYDFETNCPLTSAVLKKLFIFEVTVESFFRNRDVSPFFEEAVQQFLTFLLCTASSRFVVLAAGLESCALRVKQGDPREFHLTFEFSPDSVIRWATCGGEFPKCDTCFRYVVRIAKRFHGFVECERVPLPL